MTRIIAGFAGSARLAVPKHGTRPTSDRVREAVFSALDAQDAVRGARVLDLYAGSGALGLEAASRGAASVDLVERDAQAAGICRRNVREVLGRAGAQPPAVRVHARSVRQVLESASGTYDLVFIDPPYELGEDALAGDLEALVPLLSDDALVLVERSARSAEPRWPAGLEAVRRRDYGETAVHTAVPVG